MYNYDRDNTVNLFEVEAVQDASFPQGSTAYSVSFILTRASLNGMQPLPLPATIQTIADLIDSGDIMDAEKKVFFELLPLALKLHETDRDQNGWRHSEYDGHANAFVYTIRNRWIEEGERRERERQEQKTLFEKLKELFGFVVRD